jgi:hypothetical protein
MPNYLLEQENQNGNNPVFREVANKVRAQKQRRRPHIEVGFVVDQAVCIALTDVHTDVRAKKKILIGGLLKNIK